MIVLDTTIVTVALPSILEDLRVSNAVLTWIVNAYMLTFGGFLLLSGRLGDLFGRRRLFLIGLGLFTLASLACGLARNEGVLLTGRAAQGLGAATVTAVSLSLILDLFPEPVERARAMGVFGFVCAGGGSVGEFCGGLITGSLGWHWIFLVNIPIGLTVFGLCLMFLPPDRPSGELRQLDVKGAVSITAALTLLVYALDVGKDIGSTSAENPILLGLAVALLVLFLLNELRAGDPLIPLRLFRLRNFASANGLGSLWAAGSLTWFVMSALYLQQVLGYSPLRVGLAFAPATLIMAAFSVGLSAKVVIRFGALVPLCIGLALSAAGLALLARAPLAGTYPVDVLPAMLLLGVGGGLASNPLLLAAMQGVDPGDTGIASGIINTAFMMGGALGLAGVARVANLRTSGLRSSGVEAIAAINGGYHVAFLIGAFLTAAAAVYGALALRRHLSDFGVNDGSVWAKVR
jgi:EmrB/QacA subfamily drug resistance transporter